MTATPPADRAYRGDIEGLRGVAVLAVVLYHAGFFSGGYVGVDVFFVISGFLITSLLWRELQARGTISFTSFYARRARRLLPAAVLVLVATTVASALALSPLRARDVMADARAAALYVANLRFAAQRADYLAAGAPPSPLQHYWSLAVEEQFYLVWPLLMLACSLAWRRSRTVSARAVAILLGAVGVASLALCAHLTEVSQPTAFFMLPTRAWELAAGGLLAVGAVHVGRLPRVVAAQVGWAGMAAVVWLVTRLTASTPFPGVAAVTPVAGTVALLAAGTAAPRRGVSLALATRPLRAVGRISYSWYLWHWPALVLAPEVLGHPLGRPASLAVAAATGLLASATVAVVENPARYSVRLTARPTWSLAGGAALTATALLAATLVGGGLPSLVGPGGPAVAAAATAPGPQRATAAARLDELARPVSAALARSVAVRQVPVNLDPPLSRAAEDKAPPFSDGCNNAYTDAQVHRCVYTNPQSTTPVVLFGDSHAAQWFPALDVAAGRYGWRFESLTKAVCPPVMAQIWSPYLGREFRECDAWHTAAMDRIVAERRALVVIGAARHYDSSYRLSVYGPAWIAGLKRTVEQLHGHGIPVLVLGPTPHPKHNGPGCLVLHLRDVTACTQSVAVSVNAPGVAEERAAVEAAGGRYLDVTPWICAVSVCPVIVDNLLVYRDDSHLTTTYVTWIAPLLGEVLGEAAQRPH